MLHPSKTSPRTNEVPGSVQCRSWREWFGRTRTRDYRSSSSPRERQTTCANQSERHTRHGNAPVPVSDETVAQVVAFLRALIPMAHDSHVAGNGEAGKATVFVAACFMCLAAAVVATQIDPSRVLSEIAKRR